METMCRLDVQKKRKNLGSVGVEESQGVTAGAIRANDGLNIREVFKKSKWKFKMAFAMRGGGSRGGLECHIPILKNDFFKNHLESFPDCENVFCT